MHFSRLRLTGFKSFVDGTEMWVEPGLTGIVGPNGCGKSNLVEALRWVMGETSAKQMRGGEMDDVIFGGTDERPPRNIAEVSLILDNADRTAPAMFNDQGEIDIVRRIERGSGSVYRINGREVRARDVQTLFADVDSGARSTALVSQGRIGALISAKPTDRRHLLEEAAGITGLHSRRHEAELRLRAADTNLERLDDVLAALEEQLKGLKRQARQATRYRNLSDHIRRAEAIGLHWQWIEATAQRKTAAERMAETETQVAEITRLAAAATTRHTEAGETIPGLRQVEAEAAAALQRLLLARDALEAEEQRLELAQREITARLAQVAGDVDRETALRADAGEAIGRLETDIAAIRDAQDGEEEGLAAARERLSTAGAAVNELEGEFTRITGKIATDEAHQAALDRQLSDLELRCARIRLRLDEIARETGDAAAEVVDEEVLAEARTHTVAARETLELARSDHDTADQTRAATQSAEVEARESLQLAESAVARLCVEEEALASLLTIRDPDLWPPMIDAVTVEPGFEVALAAALGNDLGAPTDEASPVHWRLLPPFDDPAPLPAGATPLSAVVHGPAALERRLGQIGVVENETDGTRLAGQLAQGQRLVSKAGGLWRWDGFTAIGDATETAANRLAQHNRLKELHEHREKAAGQLEDVRALFAKVREAARESGTREREARDTVRQSDTAFQEARDNLAALEGKSAHARSRQDALQEAAERLRVDEAEIDALVAEANEELAALAAIAADRETAEALRAELALARSTASECQSDHDRLIREAASRHQRSLDIDGELALWRRRTENADNQLEQLEQRRSAAVAEQKRLETRPAEIAAQRDALFTQISAAEAHRDKAADTLAEQETRLAEIGRDLRAREARLAEAREERVRCEAAIEQADQIMAGVTERARERLDCTPAEALGSVDVEDDDKLPDRDAAEARLERLKRERDNMGPVNLRADIEAQELDERIQTMLSERNDLVSAIARLRQGIAGLNREGRARLLAAFKEVDTHFRELFVRLFGGGRAHLSLSDADDPLEAGLEIMASPPGKKLQTMSLLSGGEQALTALSLLFAVFMTNPAPICVLDEVDAPLDDANVERFCQLLAEIAADSATRFLLVTHHRLTMARMDRLFGVTMAERGVSQLVSVDLQVAESLRAQA